jgi:Protein of unknown function (DUF3014)
MNKPLLYLLLTALAAGALALGYWELYERPRAEFEKANSLTRAPPPAVKEEKPRFPLPADSSLEPPAPAQAEKTPSLESQLRSALGEKLLALLEDENLVQRFVVTVMHERDRRIPGRFLLWKPLPGHFQVDNKAGEIILGPENSSRYQPYAREFAALDEQKLLAAYHSHYNSFQKAYADAGNSGYFNDALVDAIDDLLQTPEPKGPVQLKQADSRFVFAEESLESLSSGQRLLLRLGTENAATVKQKLRSLRSKLTGQ